MGRPWTDNTAESEGLFPVLLRRWWLLLLCVAVGAGVAGVVSNMQQKQYQAEAQLLFRNDSNPDLSLQAAFGLPPSANAVDPSTQTATNVALVSVEQVAAMTAKALGHGLTAGEVASKVSVHEVGQSALVTITSTDPNPAFAASLATTFAHQFINFSASADRSLFVQALRTIQSQLAALPPQARSGSAGQVLRNREQSLSTLASLQTGNAQLVQPASVPTAAALPRTKLNVAAGALFGLIIGIALTLLIHRLDRRMRTPDEFAEAYHLPLLGVVPQTRQLRAKRRRAIQANGSDLPPVTADAYRALRTRLWYSNGDRDLRSLLVTSAARGEGKSTTAWQLARAVAMTGKARVLLLEADLRDPTIANTHGLHAFPGLADVLRERLDVDAVIQQVEICPPSPTDDGRPESGADPVEHILDLDGEAVGDLGAAFGDSGALDDDEAPDAPEEPDAHEGIAPACTMDVLVAGAIPLTPSELLDSEEMSELLDSLRSRYDCVILDAPPAHVVTDTLPLMRQASGVIVVSSLRYASRRAAEHLRRELEALGAPLLGVLVNNAKRAPTYDYGAYGASGASVEWLTLNTEAAPASNGNDHVTGRIAP